MNKMELRERIRTCPRNRRTLDFDPRRSPRSLHSLVSDHFLVCPTSSQLCRFGGTKVSQRKTHERNGKLDGKGSVGKGGKYDPRRLCLRTLHHPSMGKLRHGRLQSSLPFSKQFIHSFIHSSEENRRIFFPSSILLCPTYYRYVTGNRTDRWRCLILSPPRNQSILPRMDGFQASPAIP